MTLTSPKEKEIPLRFIQSEQIRGAFFRAGGIGGGADAICIENLQLRGPRLHRGSALDRMVRENPGVLKNKTIWVIEVEPRLRLDLRSYITSAGYVQTEK